MKCILQQKTVIEKDFTARKHYLQSIVIMSLYHNNLFIFEFRSIFT